ncbi:unnamed protein product, partial [Closterium sp. Naga37s-1]
LSNSPPSPQPCRTYALMLLCSHTLTRARMWRARRCREILDLRVWPNEKTRKAWDERLRKSTRVSLPCVPCHALLSSAHSLAAASPSAPTAAPLRQAQRALPRGRSVWRAAAARGGRRGGSRGIDAGNRCLGWRSEGGQWEGGCARVSSNGAKRRVISSGAVRVGECGTVPLPPLPSALLPSPQARLHSPHPSPLAPFPSRTLPLSHPSPLAPFPSRTLPLSHPSPLAPFPSRTRPLSHPSPLAPFPSRTLPLSHPSPLAPFPALTPSLFPTHFTLFHASSLSPFPAFPPLQCPPHVRVSSAHLSQGEGRAPSAPTGCRPSAVVASGAQPGGAGSAALLHHANAAPSNSPPPFPPFSPHPLPSPLLTGPGSGGA